MGVYFLIFVFLFLALDRHGFLFFVFCLEPSPARHTNFLKPKVDFARLMYLYVVVKSTCS